MNKSRGDLAYNIVDYSGDLTQAVIDQLSSIEGVIKVTDLS